MFNREETLSNRCNLLDLEIGCEEILQNCISRNTQNGDEEDCKQKGGTREDGSEEGGGEERANSEENVLDDKSGDGKYQTIGNTAMEDMSLGRMNEGWREIKFLRKSMRTHNPYVVIPHEEIIDEMENNGVQDQFLPCQHQSTVQLSYPNHTRGPIA